ncbi:MAG: hypothetical protein AAF573_04585, partial [Bacteroidota bacterium]
TTVIAQQLRMPDEIEQYMKKSAIQYQMESLTTLLQPISLPLVEKGLSIKNTDEGTRLEKENKVLSKKAQKLVKKAEKAEAKNNYSKALKYYKKALKADPHHTKILNELSSLYWTQDALEEVIFYAKKIVEQNPINFEAHARLALAYQKLEKSDLALEHIHLAHLYNRNHKKVIQIMKSIYVDNGMVYRDFVFNPQYKIENKDGRIAVQANDVPWKTYAACQALWENDTTYRDQMRYLSNIETKEIQQKECLLNALIGYERMEGGKEKFPALKVLGTSLRYRMVDDFVLYEITLRKNPNLIFILTEEKKQRLIRYMTSVRVNKEPIAE